MRRGTRSFLPAMAGFFVVAAALPLSSPAPALALAAECQQPFTPTYEIQGSGSSAAITGDVTTQGVVVGELLGNNGGFYLQDAIGDGDAATSDGIFVYTDEADTVSVGETVRVTGYARERFDETAINGEDGDFAVVTQVLDCDASASVTPVDVVMPFPTTTYLERFEGMLVRFPQSLVISEYFNYDRFGEIVLGLPLPGEDRHYTPTSVIEPGRAAQVRAHKYLLRRVTLDDGLTSSNPSFTRHPNGDAFTLANRFRGGDLVANAVGALSFSFGAYKIQPTAPAEYTAVNPRPGEPEDVGGRLKVAAFNMLNYFLTPDSIQEGSRDPDDPADNVCGPVDHKVECRGHDANQPQELTRQRTKLLAALMGVDAHIVGVNEIENTPGVEPLADIVNGLNGTLGAGTYDYIDTGVIGPDVIRVGFIYRPGAVQPVGGFAILDSSVDARFDDTLSRPALAQTFREVATGEVFTVVVNHLKSKGQSGLRDQGDPNYDQGDGQGFWNHARTLAAEALVDWLATDPTKSGDPDFLVTGDLNAYAREDPIDAVIAGPDSTGGTPDGYTNLIKKYEGRYAYSYVFDGQAGYLDHALANRSLTRQVTGATIWHINADEPDLLDYDTSFKSAAQDALFEQNAYRSSDHDPVIVGFDLGD